MTCIDCGAPTQWDSRVLRCRSCAGRHRWEQGQSPAPPEMTPEIRAKLSAAAIQREAERHGRAPVTDDVKQAIRLAYASGGSQRGIASRHGISDWRVWSIVNEAPAIKRHRPRKVVAARVHLCRACGHEFEPDGRQQNCDPCRALAHAEARRKDNERQRIQYHKRRQAS